MTRGGLLLAIDQGTTNTKAILVARDGRPVFVATAPVALQHPRADFVEQDPLDLWASVTRAAADCVAKAGREGIAAIGITNQRETVVAWERRTGEPVAPAVVWQCRRSAAICAELERRGLVGMLRARTGLGIDPLFSATKILWLLENIPGLRERAEAGEICFGTVDSWLIWKLTGGRVHACDASNASRTQLLNLRTGQWDEDLLRLFGIPRVALPEVFESSGFFGECAGVEGLSGVPILSAIGDSHAAMAGHGAYDPGKIKATYGTGSSVMSLIPEFRVAENGLSTTIAWRMGGATRFALEGNISMAGSAVQWVGEFLGLAEPAPGAASLAETVRGSEGVYFVPAMVGLGAPHWDSAVRGAIFGLSCSSTSAHLAKAAVEAIAFQIRDVFDAMEREANCAFPMLHADGGATHNDQLMQFQADVLGRPVMRSTCPDLSALGAAWLAGIALGYWNSLEALGQLGLDSQIFEPRMPEIEREQRYGGWKLAVERARHRASSQPETEKAFDAAEKEHAQH
jgi:glycerol kinase